jgi:RsiW-degrading membrane proteinase PrsW (M82 family)
MYLDHFLHIFAALLPAIVILVYIYKQDKFPEPKKIVFKTFLFGCATVLGIDLLIPVFDHFSEENFKGNTYYFFDSFIRAGFLEEFFKSVVIIFFCTRKSVFDEPMDGIVYGVAASLGFAAYENIDYVRYFAEKTSILDISLIRTFSAVPMHALCGVMMGFLISLSIFSKKNNYLFLVLSILIPVGMHGLYNFSLSSDLFYRFKNFFFLNRTNFFPFVTIRILCFLDHLNQFTMQYCKFNKHTIQIIITIYFIIIN